MYVYEFPAYDPETVPKGEDLPTPIRFFNQLHLAFFFRRLDGMTGVPVPLVRASADPEKLEAAGEILRFFKGAREEAEREGTYRLKTEGAVLAIDKMAKDLLRQHWDAYVQAQLGYSDVDLVEEINAQFGVLDESKLTAEEYAQRFPAPEESS